MVRIQLGGLDKVSNSSVEIALLKVSGTSVCVDLCPGRIQLDGFVKVSNGRIPGILAVIGETSVVIDLGTVRQ